MLSKPATMLMGFIYEKPINAYEIIKMLKAMNIKWWYNIADSTVYSTLKVLEKRDLISGAVEKVGNMPDRTIYSLTDKGKNELFDTLKNSIIQFDYDTNIFSIAAFFLDIFPLDKQRTLLQARLDILHKHLTGIERQFKLLEESDIPSIHVANVKRMMDLVDAEILGTGRLLEATNSKE